MLLCISPSNIESQLERDHYRLYDLIWKRTVACQMENVLIDIVSSTLESNSKNFAARASGSTIAFDGFYKIYQEGKDDEKEEANKGL